MFVKSLAAWQVEKLYVFGLFTNIVWREKFCNILSHSIPKKVRTKVIETFGNTNVSLYWLFMKFMQKKLFSQKLAT